ncbi:MAG: hypothetical protein DI533_12585 [Cereibacter sphaeroides]|uniref:50S ribosomal protein L35 n=1 Tax=Cereibacter sphaeroides TaxID=1063 RepID=A0A2W5SAN7_CERSP|nr:MAG: hypothetical protein DI533_12585 [Cereibacter sphaeroides]
MDTDLMMVIGITLGVLSVPSLLSAFSEGRPPRFAAIIILVAGILVVAAIYQRPSGYSFQDIVGSFRNVIARFLS